MRHLKKKKIFSRNREHRSAMFSNQIISLFNYSRIKTTSAKAKEARRLSEKLITRARVDNLHNRRIVLSKLKDRAIVAKLFDEIAPKYKGVNGGYTRIIRLGRRMGDGADLSILELVEGEATKSKAKVKKPKVTSEK